MIDDHGYDNNSVSQRFGISPKIIIFASGLLQNLAKMCQKYKKVNLDQCLGCLALSIEKL